MTDRQEWLQAIKAIALEVDQTALCLANDIPIPRARAREVDGVIRSLKNCSSKLKTIAGVTKPAPAAEPQGEPVNQQEPLPGVEQP